MFYLLLKQYNLKDVVFFKNEMIDEPNAVWGTLASEAAMAGGGAGGIYWPNKQTIKSDMFI